MQKALFETEQFIKVPEKRTIETRSKIKKFKFENDYHKSTCPTRRCLYCLNSIEKSISMTDRSVLKCALIGNTNSVKTDIGKTMVCDLFKG